MPTTPLPTSKTPAALCIDTPIGVLTVETRIDNGQESVCRAYFGHTEPPSAETPLLREAASQLRAYFAGALTSFDVPISVDGSTFQHAVWDALTDIPYGETCTYGEIAARVYRPAAARAVGGACHRNPVAIFVPCHRVIGTNGSLTGYAGGLNVKSYLLALEKRYRNS